LNKVFAACPFHPLSAGFAAAECGSTFMNFVGSQHFNDGLPSVDRITFYRSLRADETDCRSNDFNAVQPTHHFFIR